MTFKRNLLVTSLFLLMHFVLGQKQPKCDTILLSDICVNHICFGDSISSILSSFGKPDTIILKSNQGFEFEEPIHKEYFYQGLLFYEILYPNLSEELFYGCRITKKNVQLTIKGIVLRLGKTKQDIIFSNFTSAIIKKGETQDKEQYIYLKINLPPTLKKVEGAFISELHLYFTNNVLTQAETIFDLN